MKASTKPLTQRNTEDGNYVALRLKARDKLRGNHEEAAELTAFLAGPISELADLRDEINRTKARYHKLVERHAELANEISRHQAFMAPVRRLPVDVIREIFINCLPDDPQRRYQRARVSYPPYPDMQWLAEHRT